MYKWTVEIQVSDTWVEDGFNLTKDRLHEMVCNDLVHAHGSEIEVKILKAPSAKSIRIEQGYKK